MTWDERIKTIRAMEKFGGSFVKALATAWQRADENNSARIEAAFPEYIEKYWVISSKPQNGDANGMTPELMKFCKDCANYFPGTPVNCRAPENKEIELVTGTTVTAMTAAVARECKTIGCGDRARWFKPLPDEAA